MRTMLLSFKPSVFKKLLSGEKIYEHRKVFPDEPIEAYLYVSAPVKSIVGILHLENRVLIESWLDKYSYNEEAQKRIKAYLKTQKYAMEIKDFQNTNKISLEILRKDVPNFVVPQMYYYIDQTYLLDYLKKNLFPRGEKIKHDFDSISSEQICI